MVVACSHAGARKFLTCCSILGGTNGEIDYSRHVQVLQPAIELGENGFPVSPITAYYWGRGAEQLKSQGGSGIKALLQPDGTAPKAGQLQKNAHLAATFKSLAEHGAEEGDSPLFFFVPVVI